MWNKKISYLVQAITNRKQLWKENLEGLTFKSSEAQLIVPFIEKKMLMTLVQANTWTDKRMNKTRLSKANLDKSSKPQVISDQPQEDNVLVQQKVLYSLFRWNVAWLIWCYTHRHFKENIKTKKLFGKPQKDISWKGPFRIYSYSFCSLRRKKSLEIKENQ